MRSNNAIAGVLLGVSALAACSGKNAAETDAGIFPTPQVIFSQVQNSIASGAALSPDKPCHLDLAKQGAEELQSRFVSDFLRMKVPAFYSFQWSSKDNVADVTYMQSQPTFSVRIRATVKDFRCEAFTIHDPTVEMPSDPSITAHHKPLPRSGMDKVLAVGGEA